MGQRMSHSLLQKKGINRAKGFKNQAFKVFKVCTKVGNYIDTIIEELQVKKLKIGGQIITWNQIHVKLQDNHMKWKMDIVQGEP